MVIAKKRIHLLIQIKKEDLFTYSWAEVDLEQACVCVHCQQRFVEVSLTGFLQPLGPL